MSDKKYEKPENMKRYSGTVESVKVEYRRPFRAVKWDRNRQDVYLNVMMRDASGEAIYFNSPKGSYGRNGYWIKYGAADWLETRQGEALPKVKEGDQITVEANLKAERVSKAGRPYKALNWVKRVTAADTNADWDATRQAWGLAQDD